MEYVRLVFADLNGAVKGKLIPKNEYNSSSVYGMPRSVLLQDIEGEENHEITDFTPDSADTDMLLVPDTDTFCEAPGKEGIEQVIVDLKNKDGSSLQESPRTVLKNAIERFNKYGYDLKIASELEFYLFKENGELFDNRELDQPYGDINALDKLNGLLNSFVEGTGKIGLRAEAVLSEAGPGQMEINFRPGQFLEVADKTLLFKQMIREVARSQGVQATFLAKPMAEHAGNGLHLHLSLWKEGQNLFASDNQLFENFLSGLIKYTHELYALFAPNPNSYRRISLVHGYAPVGLTWGEDDRRVALRTLGEGEGRRIEHRIAGSDANIYLVIAAMIHSGLQGIDEGLRLADDSVKSRLGEPFTDNLPQALEIFSRSELAREVFGDKFVDAYCSVKQQEWRKFQAQITQWEQNTYGTIV